MSRVLGGLNLMREHEADSMQPARCAACGVAVRAGLGDPCQCTRCVDAAIAAHDSAADRVAMCVRRARAASRDAVKFVRFADRASDPRVREDYRGTAHKVWRSCRAWMAAARALRAVVS